MKKEKTEFEGYKELLKKQVQEALDSKNKYLLIYETLEMEYLCLCSFTGEEPEGEG